MISNCSYLWPQPSDTGTCTFLALDTVEVSADPWRSPDAGAVQSVCPMWWPMTRGTTPLPKGSLPQPWLMPQLVRGIKPG